MKIFLLAILLLAPISFAQQSQWVKLDPATGKLTYQNTPTGDRILDFSSAGYQGGGVALPEVAVAQTLAPSKTDDDSVLIQAALDTLAKAEPKNGFRGALLLRPGTYNCKSAISIRASGIVLRGSGSGPEGTILKLTGNPHLALAISSRVSTQASGTPTSITDAYVPSGASIFHVKDTTGLSTGDTIRITKPVTAAWVHFMGMDTLVRDGKKETWVSGEIPCYRTIQSVSGNQVTLDLPLADNLDAKFLTPNGASVAKVTRTGQISQCGIESMRIVSPPQPVEMATRHNQALRITGATDCWAKDLQIENTMNSVGVGSSSSRITLQDINITHAAPSKGAAKPADFSADGSQVLIQRCSATGDNLFYFVTGARVTGPIVVLNCTFHGNGHIQPHQRWATGLLVDNCHVPESGIDFMNRGEMGSGHGWTIGWSVAWNCTAKTFVIQQPPGTMNWAIGCKGERQQAVMPFNHDTKLPEGTYDAHNTHVTPQSLYLAQLKERLGPQALKNIGY